jgi:hypothetical protein
MPSRGDRARPTAPRQTVTVDEIKDGLLARLDQVLDRYAPPAPGSHRTGGRYFTLNPGRADRHVGSFYVTLAGPAAGRWTDHATGQHGDVIDLIALSLGLDARGAFAEARAFLGLETESPEHRRARERAAEAARLRRAAEAQAAEQKREAARSHAQALWLSGAERIAGTPVDAYLRARGIDLAPLGRQPRALRYHAACRYHRGRIVDRVDPETGAIARRAQSLPPLTLPAMLAAITDGRGRHIGTHRTYLAIGGDGRWGKAPVDTPKKVLGDMAGGAIRLWSGAGPRGGKGCPLSECAPGTRVYIAEGIETALSAVVLRPEARVLAAISLSNMGAVDLPANVAEVVLIADGDDDPQAQAALQRAIDAHVARGRRVRLVQAPAGQDLNDCLRAAQRAQAAAQGGAA